MEISDRQDLTSDEAAKEYVKLRDTLYAGELPDDDSHETQDRIEDRIYELQHIIINAAIERTTFPNALGNPPPVISNPKPFLQGKT